jgi:hypothetical protein
VKKVILHGYDGPLKRIPQEEYSWEPFTGQAAAQVSDSVWSIPDGQADWWADSAHDEVTRCEIRQLVMERFPFKFKRFSTFYQARNDRVKVYYLVVTVEEKEDDGSLPLPGAIASLTNDIMSDMTKHDADLPWRVVSVTDDEEPEE